jgi:hypothetical protein
LIGLAFFAGAWEQAHGAPPVEVQSVRVGFGSSSAFKIGCWTPVRVQLKASQERLAGFMELIVPDDDGTPTSYRLPVDIPPGPGSATYTAYGRPGAHDAEFTIRILDAQGRRVLEAPQEKTMRLPPEVITPEEMLILTLGQPIGVEEIQNLPGFTAGGKGLTRSGSAEVIVARIDAQAEQIPGRWYGFDAAHCIVIDTDDREAMQKLDGLRGQALVEWVRHGGHLVVAVGAHWQAVRDSVLGPILPAQPVGQERVPSLEALTAFAGSTKPITPVGTPPSMVTRLEGEKQRGGKVLSMEGSSLPLVVRGAQGFGRVTLIGVGVDQNIFSAWPDRGLFWARALDLRSDRPDQTGSGSAVGRGGRFYQSGVSDLSSQLRIGLEQFPGVKLIPFGWVAFFIFLYILLIGPVDYLFLKKVIKRMELTWITFPTIVVTVSLLAYFAAYRLKGNDLLINKVDVIDVDQAGGLVRGRTLVCLFSPQNRDYSVGFVPVSPSADDLPVLAETSGSGEPPRPPAGTELVTTWFSVPEPQFGAMGGTNRRFNFTGSGYSYQPAGGLERMENVRIPIWSTRTFSGRWFGPGGSLVAAELRSVGRDLLAGTVTNRHSFPLENAILAFGKQVYVLGTIAPGATVMVSGDRNLSGHLRDHAANYLSNQPWNRNLKINRADLLLAAMFHDSQSTQGGGPSLGNAALHDLDLTGQLDLERPMLVAAIKRPGAQLVLDNAPSPPKIDQTTMLRVILPLSQSSQDTGRAVATTLPQSSVAAGLTKSR